MAERRMFAKSIVLSDAFLDMPSDSRLLYFTMGMLADDDGFVNNPKSIMRQIGASEDDLKVLLAKRYVLGFDDGVLVIKHWRINNYLQNDRLNPTSYFEHKSQLALDEKKAYVFKNPEDEANVYTEQPSVYTQDSIGKDRLGKDNISSTYIDSNIRESSSTYHRQLNSARAEKKAYGKYGNVWLEERELSNLKTMYPNWQKLIDNLSSYLKKTGKTYDDHYVTICEWADEDAAKAKEKPKGKKSEPTDGGSFDTEEFFAAAKARA